MSQSLRIGGVVLCGGESRRMGQPKAWLPFGNELMLQRVVRLLASVVEPIVVVAAPDQAVPPMPDLVTIVRDERRGRGPLEGLAAGLRTIRQLGADAAYASSTDVPFLRPEFVRCMIEQLGDAEIAVPFVDERHHPLASVYRVAVLPHIESLLTADRLRPVFLYDAVPTRVVHADELRAADPTLQTLRNLNTPEEYARALREAELVDG